ncbi:MAG: hypothetical protein TYPL_4650 [Candidatus Tyloplasma litorale]|nr:MAG: hypothetical protein TYPL_4650 [Mycoplasmatales bacterium]
MKTKKMNNKKNKFWLKSWIFFVILVLIVSMGIGAIIGIINPPTYDYIQIYLNGQIYNASEIDLGSDEDLSDEERALLLENAFYSLALFGSTDINSINDSSDEYNYIFKTNQEWNVPYILSSEETNNQELTKDFFVMKFINDTQTSSVAQYLLNLATTSNDPFKVIYALTKLQEDAESADENWITITGLELATKSEYEISRTIIFDTLKQDSTYQNEVLSDMMIYSYLWQSASQKAYDYNLTKELAYERPSIVASMTLDSEILQNNYLSQQQTLESLDSKTNNVQASEWNQMMEDLMGSQIKTSALIDDTIYDNTFDQSDVSSTFRGFQGIVFGTSAGEGISSDWTDATNTWKFLDSEEEIDLGEAITENSVYTHESIMSNANVYIADTSNGADGKGGLIYNTSSDITDPNPAADPGQKTVYAYNQLYPYMFMETSESSNTNLWNLNDEYYSLFAHKDKDNNQYTPVLSDEEMNDSDLTYIFDEWFPNQPIFGEIYVSEALIAQDTDLEAKTLNYWKEKGFYIELSGTWEDELLQFLPSWIINDNE